MSLNGQNEVAIVTAYFNIDRENFTVYPRDKERYFSFFKVWAGLKNQLIVFCTHEDEDEIKKIRKKRGGI